MKGTLACGLGGALLIVMLAAPVASAATKPCHLPHQTGQTSVPLASAGFDRPYSLYVPSGYDGRKPLPLVLVLHGSGGNGLGLMELSRMAPVADAHRFAVAAPNGAVQQGLDSYSWNVPGVPLTTGSQVPPGTPSDEAYLRDVIRTTARTVCIDRDRVYMSGFSGGARMTSQMACDKAKMISAIAPVAGLRAGVPMETSPDVWAPDPSTCRPKEPVAVRTFHGTADTTNPYEGNDEPRWGYSVDIALARWAKLDRCRKGPSSSAISATVTLVTYSKCASDTSVGLYRTEGAEHVWPGDPVAADRQATSELIWKFFKNQQR